MMKNYIEKVGENYFCLTSHIDNSAPCNNCFFLDRNTLECKFPKNEDKKCEHMTSDYKGWNTKEYEFIPESLYKLYGVFDISKE